MASESVAVRIARMRMETAKIKAEGEFKVVQLRIQGNKALHLQRAKNRAAADKQEREFAIEVEREKRETEKLRGKNMLRREEERTLQALIRAGIV